MEAQTSSLSARRMVKKINKSKKAKEGSILKMLDERFNGPSVGGVYAIPPEYTIIELDPENSVDMLAIDRLGGLPDADGKRRNPQQRLYTLAELEELKDYDFKQKLPFVDTSALK